MLCLLLTHCLDGREPMKIRGAMTLLRLVGINRNKCNEKYLHETHFGITDSGIYNIFVGHITARKPQCRLTFAAKYTAATAISFGGSSDMSLWSIYHSEAPTPHYVTAYCPPPLVLRGSCRESCMVIIEQCRKSDIRA